MINFDIDEELFLSIAEAMCNIVPEVLDLGIIDTAEQILGSETIYFMEKLHLPQI
jgi:hypothetical protein